MLTTQQALDRMYFLHKEHHGAVRGNNFMECPICKIHVHEHNGESGSYLIQHWKEGDPIERLELADFEPVEETHPYSGNVYDQDGELVAVWHEGIRLA
jgi:hypothetical protein